MGLDGTTLAGIWDCWSANMICLKYSEFADYGLIDEIGWWSIVKLMPNRRYQTDIVVDIYNDPYLGI